MRGTGLILALLLPVPALAAGFDCTKASRPIEKRICADPALSAADDQLNTVFNAASAVLGADALKPSQMAWIARRDHAKPAELLPLYRARIAELQALAVNTPPAADTPTAPASPVAPAAPDSPAAPATSAAPPAVSPADADTATAAPAPAATPQNAPVALITAGPDVPAPAAQLRDTQFTDAYGETLLTVTTPGRFSLQTHSKRGASLQLVDMMTGPGEVAGIAGVRNGRLDVLLDRGTYKVRLQRAPDDTTGPTLLSATPFTAAPPPAQLKPGVTYSATLADQQMQGLWLTVTQPGRVRIELAGRALGDVRLWREGRDLLPDIATSTTITPTPTHPLTELVLTPDLSPGTYLVTAYGGEPLPWTDGDAGMPFYLRTGDSDAFAAGWLHGRIGPLGSERLTVGSQAYRFALRLPEVAAVSLGTLTGGSDNSVCLCEPAKTREPSLLLLPGPRRSAYRTITVSGAAGQEFDLRGFGGVGTPPTAPGDYQILAASHGFGGDELPLTAVLIRHLQPDGAGPMGVGQSRQQVIASSAPAIGPGAAYHARFNLRGASTLLFQVTAAGPVVARVQGVAASSTISPLITDQQADTVLTTDASKPLPLAAGWYRLSLTPAAGKVGVADLVLGPPDSDPSALSPGLPADPVLSFGPRTIQLFESLSLQTNAAPGADADLVGLDIVHRLADAPLTVTQPADTPLTLGLAAVPALTVTDIDRRLPVEGASFDSAANRLTIPAVGYARTLSIALPPSPPALPKPAPQPEAAMPVLGLGKPVWLDLTRNAEAYYQLSLPQGGLYRLETLGRLRTNGRLATSFIPDLAQEEADGIGQNMLIQRFLRDGRYALTVKAASSAGHLGLLATQAPLPEGPVLTENGSVRTTLKVGAGMVFPIDITQDGDYALSLIALNRGVTARLEDAEGWPLRPIGEFHDETISFRPGRYRLVVMPGGTEARVVARLLRPETVALPQGHGPMMLPFERGVAHVWQGPDPDIWTFALHGDALVEITVSDDMGGEIQRDDGTRVGTIAQAIADADGTAYNFKATLPAGHYRIKARPVGRQSRMDYTLTLATKELQPATERRVSLPATLAFSLAKDQVVSLTSFTGQPLYAVLRDAAGKQIVQSAGRTDDWNIAISQLLPAGRYTLELKPYAATQDGADAGNADDNSDNGNDNASNDNSGTDQATDADTGGNVAIRLSLPADRETVAADTDAAATLTAGGVHRLSLPAATQALTVARAAADVELVLALEAQGGDGQWRQIAQARGLAPVIAAENGSEPKRLAVWAVDGGEAPIQLQAKQISPAPEALAAAQFHPVGIGDLAIAAIDAGAPGLLTLPAPEGVSAASAPGAAFHALDGAVIAPQSRTLYLLRSHDGAVGARSTDTAASVQDIALGGGEAAHVATPDHAPDQIPLWMVDAMRGQPGIDTGSGRGIAADGSVLALAGSQDAILGNGDGAAPIRLRLHPLMLTQSGETADGQSLSLNLPPMTALPVTLGAGAKRTHITLGVGGGAVLGPQTDTARTLWSGGEALSREDEGNWTQALLLNTTDAPLPVALTTTPIAAAAVVTPDHPVKRFFGADGVLAVAVDARPGQTLHVAGAIMARFLPDRSLSSIQVATTGDMAMGDVAGGGQLLLTHGTGPVMVWLQGQAASLWPDGAPQSVSLPGEVTLTGQAMALALSPATPVLLGVRSSAPLILGLGDENRLFASGAALYRYLPPGETTLKLMSAQDGPLSGTLELTAQTVIPAQQGLNPTIVLAPGTSALFGFTVAREAPIGIGVRANPDTVQVRVLDGDGHELGQGVSQLLPLKPGHYLIEAGIPPNAPPTTIRAAILGNAPSSTLPPAGMIRAYMTGQAYVEPEPDQPADDGKGDADQDKSDSDKTDQ